MDGQGGLVKTTWPTGLAFPDKDKTEQDQAGLCDPAMELVAIQPPKAQRPKPPPALCSARQARPAVDDSQPSGLWRRNRGLRHVVLDCLRLSPDATPPCHSERRPVEKSKGACRSRLGLGVSAKRQCHGHGPVALPLFLCPSSTHHFPSRSMAGFSPALHPCRRVASIPRPPLLSCARLSTSWCLCSSDRTKMSAVVFFNFVWVSSSLNMWFSVSPPER
ncbi:hypothetical protein J3F84DRAFT_29366 [Trichoderma pleuroticola]